VTLTESVDDQTSATRRRLFRRPSAATVVAILAPVAFVALWAWKARTAPPLEVPNPRDVLARSRDLLIGSEASHTWTSMVRIVIATLLALVIGSCLVFVARLVPATETLVAKEILPVLNSIPSIGWAILGVIWFGVGDFAVIFVVTWILVPFCMVNMWEGLRSLDPGLIEMGRSFTRSDRKVLFRIQVPLLVPYLFASTRLSFSVGWKVALIAEFFGAKSGLGLVMNRARQSFDTATVFATIVVVMVIIVTVERLIFDPLSEMFARRSGTLEVAR
jgi:NitT/TauT family transport system permease protein